VFGLLSIRNEGNEIIKFLSLADVILSTLERLFALTLSNRSKRKIIGHVDKLAGGKICGWAALSSMEARSVYVHLLADDLVVATVEANLYREDLESAGLGTGFHAFELTLPDSRSGTQNFSIVASEVSTICNVDKRISKANASKCHNLVINNALDRFFVKKTPETKVEAAEIDREYSSSRPLILIEIQDLINFLKHHMTVTGIQRVVSGLAQTLIADELLYKDYDIRFCSAGENGYAKIIQTNDLSRLLDKVLAGGVTQNDLRALVTKLEIASAPYSLKRGDIFVIAGAYWIVPDYGSFLMHAKRSGVIVGTYIYDLIPITHPEWVTDDTRRAVTDRAIDIILLSDFFMTISAFVKTDVDRLLHDEFSEIKPVFPVPLPHILPAKGDAKTPPTIRSTDSHEEKYVLCVCTLEGRKNHYMLFRVWAALIRKHGHDKIPNLVLVGKWGWNIERFRSAVEQSSFLDNKIVIKNLVHDDELMKLYQNCLFTVFPSFVEGWGLPVGESLTFGKLCLAAKSSSIPEVGGEFAEYFDPYNFFEVFSVVEKFILDESLVKEKENLIAKSFQCRSWYGFGQDFLAKILDAYNSCQDADRTAFEKQIALDPRQVYKIDTETLCSPTTPWNVRCRQLIRSSGWSPLEAWGCWATSSKARITFRALGVDTGDLAIYIRLNLPPNQIDGSVTIINASGAVAKFVLNLTGFTWVRFTSRYSSEEMLSFTVQRDEVFGVEEPHRTLFVGMSALAFIDAGDAEGRLEVESQILRTSGLLYESSARESLTSQAENAIGQFM